MKRMVLLLAAVPLSCVSYAHAGGKGNAYGKHKIIGEPANPAAVERLLDESEVSASVEVHPRNNKTLKRYSGRFILDKDKPIEDAMLEFIVKHKDAFGLKKPKDELKLKDSYVHYKGKGGGVFQQYYDGIPVWKATLGFGYENDNEFTGGGANLIPTSDIEQIDTTPAISEEEALNIIKDKIQMPRELDWPHEKELVIYPKQEGSETRYYLAYRIGIYGTRYFVDAVTGEILSSQNVTNFDMKLDGQAEPGRVGTAHLSISS